MKTLFKDSLKNAAIISSLILGAGFASGKEIISFFVNYGKLGYLGLFLSAILFAVAAFSVMDFCYRKKIDSYVDYVEAIAGNKIGAVLEGLLGLFLFVLYSAMISAFGSIFKEAFDFSLTFGIILAGVLCYISFLFGMEGIIRLNAALSPIMIIGCICIGLYTYFFRLTDVAVLDAASVSGKWYVSAVLYASFNTITAVTVISSMRKRVNNRKTAFLSGILGGVLVFVIGISLALTLNVHRTLIEQYDIPLFALVGLYSPLFEKFFLVVFITSIFTSAATNGYSFVQWFSMRFRFKSALLGVIATVVACLCAYGGFSNFVNIIYPLFGLVGFFEMVIIIRKFLAS